MKYIDKISLIVFSVVLFVGIFEHLLILQLFDKIDLRVLQSFVLGLGYDFLNGALFGFVVLITPLPNKYRKIISFILVIAFLVFTFIDYNYVLLFGTHLPFSTHEYVNASEAFYSSAIHAIQNYSFLFLFIFPATVLIILFFFLENREFSFKQILFSRIFSLLVLILIGGVGASYSNSYVSKNMENPLTSAAIQYFYLTRNREPIEKINKPVKSLNIIKNLIPGQIPSGEKWKDYPLVRIRESSGCKNKENSLISRSLCSNIKKPNILIIMLESFRAAEVGVYGSTLGLTPEFDSWSKKGILFNNFFANGFQTRHGQVATYCSLFPNYGAAIMKRYNSNNFRCLPEILKSNSYETSWVFGSDANFDGQSSFLTKIGFDKIIDKFDFPNSTSELGWGISDEDLFRKWEIVLDNEKQPFFSSALTSTNHHPFEVPEKYKLNRGESVKHRYHEAIFYTDAMLGGFLNRISKKQWFENTIIFVIADTSSFQPTLLKTKNFEEFVKLRSKIPLLILNGKFINSASYQGRIVINEPVSQVDIAPTITDILSKKIIVPWVGISLMYKSGSFSRNIPLRSYTNRPGSYWAVIENETSFYRENDKIDHYFGKIDKNKHFLLKEIGVSWIKTINWVLQENLIWPENLNEKKY